ncbi:DUF4760 domain-containing protein [Chitinophaga arvensicola]|uniref:DUF4760 domain-containing protein n=1 Tax=Chitinophaga arvensicola TaxID=29529 RepID=A0A1I0RHX5_9BACT|nr:hypothetical protein [Chitinophaga arvensicola]SEW40288.1 hypothetical protein SAMN04488122_2840 [Chitinophaga arvensicola]
MKKLLSLLVILMMTFPLFSQSKGSPDSVRINTVQQYRQSQPVENVVAGPGKDKDALSVWVAWSQIVAALFTIVSLFFLIYQLSQLRKANNTSNKQLAFVAQANRAQVVIGLFKEFRSLGCKKARETIKAKGTETVFTDVVSYSHLLNHFGFLLEHDYIDERSVYEMMGLSVMSAWRALSPQIIKMRKDSDAPLDYYPYQYHFEYLNYRMEKYFPEGKKRIDKLLSEMAPQPPSPAAASEEIVANA